MAAKTHPHRTPPSDPLDALLYRAVQQADDSAVRTWLERLLVSGERASFVVGEGKREKAEVK
jgi:hypothetical protein